MRLTEKERELIKKAFLETFKVGSRVDDTKRGGDIDLYLCPTEQYENEKELKRKFQLLLEEYLGEQKIDIFIAKDSSRLIEQVAIRDGVEL